MNEDQSATVVNTPRATLPAQGGVDTHGHVSPEDMVHSWIGSITQLQWWGLSLLLVAVVCLIFLTYELEKWQLLMMLVGGISSLVFLAFFSHTVLSKLVDQWDSKFAAPANRLMQTISLIADDKLELLPEERRNSFTSKSHQQLLAVARNILEHQRFIDQVVDNMFEMMFLLNPDGVILKANKSASEMTKYQTNDLVGQHIRKLFPHVGNLVDYYLELEIQFTTTGMVRDLEVHIQTSEGEILPFSINGVKIESSSGDILGYTLIAKNQAETFRLINQLNRSNYDLNRANSELAKRYDLIKKEIEEKEGERRILEMELATSQLVQKTFLPQVDPSESRIHVSGTSVPAAFCGGDWWNTISIEDKFYIFVGDVTGHGTAAAMVTAAVSGYYTSVQESLLAGDVWDVDRILLGFDKVLSSMANGDVSYNMTCFSAVIDFSRKILRFANAGHNFPLLLRGNNRIEPLVVSGHRLGHPEKQPYAVAEVPLEGTEFIFLYTDGLIENRNASDEQYGKRRLRKFLELHAHEPVNDFVGKLLKESQEFYGKDKPLEDDVTFVAVRLLGFN